MIGAKLKKYRQDLKLTGETLAGLAGIKRSWLSQIENEKKYPPVDTFMNLINAIAKVSPITQENSKIILNEENYREFINLTTFSPFYFNKHTNKHVYDFETEGGYPDISTVVNIALLGNKNLQDSSGNYIVAFQTKGSHKAYSSDEDRHLYIKNSTAQNMEIELDEELRYFFFDEWKSYIHFSTEDNNGKNIFVYDLEFVRLSLYEWWYDHILQDFYDAFNTDIEISNEEMTIFGALMSLANSDGTFTPYSSEDITNIPKSLLNEKTVTFDISYIKDKNLKLTLDGKLLSNSEIEMLDVSLSAIRYRRKQK